MKLLVKSPNHGFGAKVLTTTKRTNPRQELVLIEKTIPCLFLRGDISVLRADDHTKNQGY